MELLRTRATLNESLTFLSNCFNLLFVSSKRRLKETIGTPDKGSGYWLVWWLNGGGALFPDYSNAKPRIERLIDRLHALSAQLKSEPSKDTTPLEDQLHDAMKPYRMRPTFNAAMDRDEVEITYQPLSNQSIEEWHAIEKLQELVRAGAADKLQKCEVCGVRWIYRRRKVDRCCSRLCRQKEYDEKRSKEPDRIKYMRWHYAMFRSQEWASARKRPTFEQWCKLGEPSRDKWETIQEQRRKRK